MRRKRAIRNFVALALLAVVGVVLTVFSFQLPYSHNVFNGFAKSVPQGREFSERVVAYYNASKTTQSDSEYKKDIKKASNLMEEYLKETFLDYDIFKTENGFRVEVPVLDGSSGSALEAINNAGKIEFKTENSESAAAGLTNKHIKSAESSRDYEGRFGTLITLTSEGQRALKAFTTEAVSSSGNIVILLNNEVFSENPIEQAIDSNVLFIPGNYANETVSGAAALKFNIGLQNVALELEGDVLPSDAILPENTLLYISVAAAFVVVAAIVALFLAYKSLGLIAGLTVLFKVLLTLILFVLLPNVLLSSATMAGFIVAFAIIMLNIIIASNNIQTEIKTGKKIPTAVKFAFSKTNQFLINLNAPVLAMGLLFAWTIKGPVNMFIMPILLAVVISWLFTMVFYKLIVKNYLSINSTNHKKFGVKKIEAGENNE